MDVGGRESRGDVVAECVELLGEFRRSLALVKIVPTAEDDHVQDLVSCSARDSGSFLDDSDDVIKSCAWQGEELCRSAAVKSKAIDAFELGVSNDEVGNTIQQSQLLPLMASSWPD